MRISVVIPVYNEGKSLIKLYGRIVSVLKTMECNYEIIMVDDRSSDDSWQVLKEIALIDSYVKIARLTRNFGQHSTLTAGMELSSGDYIVLMDCDQQDEPENIPLLIEELINKNVHIVYALRFERKDNMMKRIASKLINCILQKLSGYNHDSRIGTFRIFTSFVKDSYLNMPEKNRYLGGMFIWMGFQSGFINVHHQARAHGKSNYNFSRQLKLARLAILSSSTKLLSAGIYLGFIFSIVSIFFAIYYLFNKLIYNVPIGYTSIIVSIFVSTGLILMVLGIIGEYMREIVDEVKARPTFLIEEKINFQNER